MTPQPKMSTKAALSRTNMLPRCWLVLLLLALPHPASALQDSDNVIEAPDDAIPPLTSMSFEESPRINSVVFSKDGDSIYVLLNPRAINIWTVLVYFWPQLLGGGLGISAFILTLRLRKTLKRKRLIGKPYCRGCNYCLEGLPNDRCPECGDEKATCRSVIGRPMWKRVLPLSILLVLVIGG